MPASMAPAKLASARERSLALERAHEEDAAQLQALRKGSLIGLWRAVRRLRPTNKLKIAWVRSAERCYSPEG